MKNDGTGKKKYIFFVAGSLAIMSMTLSAYGIATVTPRLLKSFDSMQYYTLISLMSSIGNLLFLPIAGKLVDTIGRKPLLIFSGVVTAFASIAAAFAPTFAIFVILRALITVGLAFVTPIPSATFPFYFTKEELPKIYGLMTAFTALGTFFGSTIAGALSDAGITWLAIAYPGILTAITCAVMYVTCPDIEKKALPSIDWFGIVLLFAMVGSITYISSFGPTSGWGTPIIIAYYVLLVVSIVLFPKAEKKAKSPLFNIELFKNPVFVGTLLCTFMLVWYQSSMRNYIPLVVQNVMGQSAAISGMVSMPRTILNVIMPTFCGAWAAKNMKNRCWQGLFIAGLMVVIGMVICGVVSASSPIILVYIGLGFTGIAESFKGATQTPALTAAVSRDEIGSAISLNSMMGSMGSAISTAVFGVIHSTICADTADLVALNSANQTVFMASAASGVLVCVLAFIFVRKMAQQPEAA